MGCVHSGRGFLVLLSTSVVAGWRVGVALLFPLCSKRTSLREAMFEVVTDDVTRLVVRIFVISGVFVVAEVNCKHIIAREQSPVLYFWRILYHFVSKSYG